MPKYMSCVFLGSILVITPKCTYTTQFYAGIFEKQSRISNAIKCCTLTLAKWLMRFWIQSTFDYISIKSYNLSLFLRHFSNKATSMIKIYLNHKLKSLLYNWIMNNTIVIYIEIDWTPVAMSNQFKSNKKEII